MGTVVLLLVAIGFVGLLVLMAWLQHKRQERLAQWALRNGWTYTRSDRSLVDLSRRQPFGVGHNRRATEVLRGTWRGAPALSFTYEWTTGSGKTQTTQHAHVVALALPTYLPTLELTPEGLGASLAKLVGAQDIQFESEAFNQAYRVVASDQRVAHAIVRPQLMERLLRPDAVRTPWRIDGTWILTWAVGTTDLDRLAGRLGLLSAVVDSIPRHVWQDHGYDPLTRPDPDATIT